MAEDSTRHANLEAACSGIRPNTGQLRLHNDDDDDDDDGGGGGGSGDDDGDDDDDDDDDDDECYSYSESVLMCCYGHRSNLVKATSTGKDRVED